MSKNPELDIFFEELQAAQSECDVIDGELARLENNDPSASVRFSRIDGG
jgi:hypothetical protein